MNMYNCTSEDIIKCSDCGKDIDKFDKFYEFAFAPNKNNVLIVYLCEECKEELKWLVNAT